ncbi:TIGR03032 family protein [bacterium]|nr:TIGR03032 family protein [bacterium]
MPVPTDPPARLDCRADTGFAAWLAAHPGTVALTTYQAGKVVLVGGDGARVTVLARDYPKPMGLAVAGPQLVLATRHEVVVLADAPLLAPDFLPGQPGRYDALYLPRVRYWTGDLNVHDVGVGPDGPWVTATRFGCLARLAHRHSLEPAWRPPFVSETAPEDRCHLNGLAMAGGRPRYVTCLGETDTAGGWRANKAAGGVVVDVADGSVRLRGLSMPHSPRWHDGRLWVLDSGRGELCAADPGAGTRAVVAALPGYLRGLCLVGPFALVGLCQIRERHIFGGLPVQERHARLVCGVAVVDTRTGTTVGMLEFTAGCTELFDVVWLPGVRRPMLLNPAHPAHAEAVTAPDFSYWLRPTGEAIPTGASISGQT